MSKKRQRVPTTLTNAKRKRSNARPYGEWDDELKYTDSAVSFEALTASTLWTDSVHDPILDSLCEVEQGSEATERIGRKIVIKSIFVGGSVFLIPQEAQTSPDVAGSVLVAIILDTQTNKTQMVGSDVYASDSVYATCTPYRLMAGITRFKVLKKVLINFPPTDMVLNGLNLYDIGGFQIPFEMHLKVNIPVTYFEGDGTGIANIIDNSLHLLANRNHGDGSVRLSYNCRCRFVG